MALKRQEVFRDNHTILVACNTLTSLILDALLEQDYECRALCKSLDESHAHILLGCREKPDQDTLEEAIDYVDHVTGITPEVEYNENLSLYNARGLLDEAARSARLLAVRRLSPLLRENVEYALLVGWNGYAAILEGEERHVTLVGKYPMLAHTHPGSICLPSPHDLDGFIRLLADGGCCGIIVAPSCLFMIRRVDAVSIDDYDALLELRSRIAKAKSLEDVLHLISETGARLKSVKMELYSL